MSLSGVSHWHSNNVACWYSRAMTALSGCRLSCLVAGFGPNHPGQVCPGDLRKTPDDPLCHYAAIMPYYANIMTEPSGLKTIIP